MRNRIVFTTAAGGASDRRRGKWRRSGFLVCGCSGAALMIASPALAECTPDPVVPFDTVICEGMDADGIIVDATGVVVTVAAGAEVERIKSTAQLLSPDDFPTVYQAAIIDGTVHGIMVESGPPFAGAHFAPSTTIAITVGESGRIDRDGIDLIATPATDGMADPRDRSATAEIVNAGIITSTQAYAMRATEPDVTGFVSIANLATGVIDGIYGAIGTLINDGTIQGAGGSAIVATLSDYPFLAQREIVNRGLIGSAGAAPTIDLASLSYGGGATITNSGAIVNRGTGAAISQRSGSVSLFNEAGGIISSDGETAISLASQGFGSEIVNAGTISAQRVAISSGTGLRLRSSGAIIGDVRAIGPDAYGSSIDISMGGTVDGDILLGDGDDLVIADYGDSGNPFGGVTGRVDAGAGNDRWLAYFARDTVLTGRIAMPRSFETMAFGIGDGVTLELGAGFAARQGIILSGAWQKDYATDLATFINSATINVRGTALANDDSPYAALAVINRGTLIGRLQSADDFAVDLSNLNLASNEGTIRGIGGGGVRYAGIVPFTNSGTIIADDVAFEGIGGTLDNSGTIRSIAGTGARIVASAGDISFNSGTIRGGRVGFDLSAELVNTGLITSLETGVAISFYGILRNERDGVVSGRARAIGASALWGYVSRATVINAGLIDGDVDMATGAFDDAPTDNIFVMLPGGRLNGNLMLGSGGDLLVATLDSDAPTAITGITGAISGGGQQTLRYLVDSDRVARVGNLGLFQTVGFDLAEQASLVLDWTGPAASRLEFAGQGSADVTADLVNDGSQPLLFSGARSVRWLIDGAIAAPGPIALTSRGSLRATRSADTQSLGAVVYGGAGVFTNEGSIVVRDLTAPSPFARMVGVFNSNVVNNGSIRVGGALAIETGFDQTVVNTGRITQIAGDRASEGIQLQGGTLDNSGLVRVAGTAVLLDRQFGYGQSRVANSGTIESTGGVAIRAISDYAGHVVTNADGGRIVGAPGFAAVELSAGSRLENGGTIVGDVDMVATVIASTPFYPGSTYISAGGRLTGNLSFGSGNDAYVHRGGSVSGTIDGEQGVDMVTLVSAMTRGTFDLARVRNFEILTLSGPGRLVLANAGGFARIHNEGSELAILTGQSLQASTLYVQRAGQLRVDGRLEAPVVNFRAGTVSGNGTVASRDLAIGDAIVLPGGDGRAGTLTLLGSVVASGQAAFAFDIGRSAHDRLAIAANGSVPGTALLDGSVYLLPVGNGPRANIDYRLITASDGVSGTFSTVIGRIGVLTPRLIYGSNDVILRYEAGSLAAHLGSTAASPDRAFALALDRLRDGSSASLADLYAGIDLLDPSGLAASLSALQPAAMWDGLAMSSQQNQMITSRVSDRMRLHGTARLVGGSLSRFGSAGGVLAAMAGQSGAGLSGAGSSAPQFGLASGILSAPGIANALPATVTGFVSMGVDPVARGSGARASSALAQAVSHIAVGIETQPDERMMIGGAFSHSAGLGRAGADQSRLQASQTVVYASRTFGHGLYAGGQLSIAQNRVVTRRAVAISDRIDGLAGMADVLAYGMQLDAGWQSGFAPGFTITPSAGFRYAASSIGMLRERGGIGALRIEGIDDSRIEGRIGARLEGNVSLGNGWTFAADIEVDHVTRIAGQGQALTVRIDAADALRFDLPLGSDLAAWTTARGGVQLHYDRLAIKAGFAFDRTSMGYADTQAVLEIAVRL